jgi:hypothetical protein
MLLSTDTTNGSVKLSTELFDIVSALIKTAQKSAPTTISLLQSIDSTRDKKGAHVEAETAADASELHISLTRPLYLQELHLGRFTSDVRDAFKNKKRYSDPLLWAACYFVLGDH